MKKSNQQATTFERENDSNHIHYPHTHVLGSYSTNQRPRFQSHEEIPIPSELSKQYSQLNKQTKLKFKRNCKKNEVVYLFQGSETGTRNFEALPPL